MTTGRQPLEDRRPGDAGEVDRLAGRAVDLAHLRWLGGGRLAPPRRCRRRALSGGDRSRSPRRVPPGRPWRGLGRRRGVVAALGVGRAGCSSSIVLRLPANCAISFFETSPMMPRPNWATLPVMCRSVVTTTRVARRRGSRPGPAISAERVAAAAGVAALGLQRWPCRRAVVALDERRLALELRGDRAELDLDDAAVDVALRSPAAGRPASAGRSARRR